MIILNLIVPGKEQAEAMSSFLLKAKYAVQVVLTKPSTLIKSDASGTEVCTDITILQFISKSVLFNEIDESLKKEFPQVDFCMYAAPAIHINSPYYDLVRSTVPGDLSVNLLKANGSSLPK